jgi:hypothetical protein
MKSILLFVITGLTIGFTACAQLRPSPPAKASATTASGLKISIDYSQPGVKGRKIWGDLVPYGQVWRTGANEATVFEISKNAKIEGKALPAGKYSLYTIPGQNSWTVIFNKTWDQSGTEYDKAQDALRITVKPVKSRAFTERMTFKIAKNGLVSLLWENLQVNFNVK